jgi:hypothetical protein
VSSNAKDELAAVMAGIKPVEECRADSSNVEKSGRTWSESSAYHKGSKSNRSGFEIQERIADKVGNNSLDIFPSVKEGWPRRKRRDRGGQSISALEQTNFRGASKTKGTVAEAVFFGKNSADNTAQSSL